MLDVAGLGFEAVLLDGMGLGVFLGNYEEFRGGGLGC